MSEYNFRITESQPPGGGVYMIGNLSGGAKSITISQSSYPDIDLSKLSTNNFFLRTTCNASASAQVYNNNDYCNVINYYTGGSVGISSYSYSGGKGTLTISESARKARVDLFEGEDRSVSQTSGYTHKVYMTKDAIK